MKFHRRVLLCAVACALACGHASARRAEVVARPALARSEPAARTPLRSPLRARAPPDALLRLRGGRKLEELTSMAKASYLGITPIVRGWVTATVVLTLLFAVGVLTPELLQFEWAASTAGLQLWRPLTAALFVGPLNPQILMRCYYWISYGQELERALGTPSYARAMLTLVALLCYVSKLLAWPFFADALIMSLTMISTRMNPDARVSLFGIPLKSKYLPFVMIASNYIQQQKPPVQDAVGVAVGYVWTVLAKLRSRELVHGAAGGGGEAGAAGGGEGDGAAAEPPKPKKKPGRRRSGSIVTDEQR
jgi:membrane associated rhomboid family serine protease